MRAAFVVPLLAALAGLVSAAPTKRGNNGRITFYSGDMLQAPSCGGDAPSDGDFVAAVPENSQFNCGDRVNLWHDGKTVTVTVRDTCATCTDPNWFDLTKSAFSTLAPLEVGVVNDIVFWYA